MYANIYSICNPRYFLLRIHICFTFIAEHLVCIYQTHFSLSPFLCALPGTHVCPLHARQIPSSFHSPCPYVQPPHIGMAVIFSPHDGQKSVIVRAFVPVLLRYLAKGIHIPQWLHCGVSYSYSKSIHSLIRFTPASNRPDQLHFFTPNFTVRHVWHNHSRQPFPFNQHFPNGFHARI